MEIAGTTLAVASLVGKTVFAIADISSSYKSAYPELARVENNPVSIREVLDGLPRDGHSVFVNVLNDLAKHVRDIQGFVDKRVKKAGARALLVKLGWHGDRVKLERMEAALETSKSTLMIAIQAWQLASRDADRKELVAGLKTSMQETMRKVSGFEFGSARIQDIRAHLDSVSRSLQERQRGAGALGTVTEVDMGKPLTTWPTFEAWLDSFTPTQDEVEQDEQPLAEGQSGSADGGDSEANGTDGQKREMNCGQKTVKICIVGLDGAADSTARIMTLSPQTEIAEVLETLHREGSTWVTGFQVGDDDDSDDAQLVGPIISQSEQCMVTVTEGASCYDASVGYAINQDETLVSFFNRTLMFRRPTRNEISISHTFDTIRVVDNYRSSLERGGTLGVQLMRTTRIPDDGKTYHLPQDFGPFPLLSTKDFEDTLPPRMKEKGGVFIPMLLREALFLSMLVPSDGPFRSFWPDSTPADEPAHETFAMRVFSGRLNVVSAADPVGSNLNAEEPEQDYIVAPKQGRFDGFTVSGRTMRQFNAVSLGSNYSAESQVSGNEVGGLQLQFAPRFKTNVQFQELLGSAPLDITATPRELGLGLNCLLIMEANSDPVSSPPSWGAKNPRPPAFDGWGFREGGYKTAESEFLWTRASWDTTSGFGSAPSSQRKGGTKESTTPPMFAAGGFPTDALGVPYREGRPQARQPTPESMSVGHLEPARPSIVSDLFAAAGVHLETPLFLKPVRPVTFNLDVKVKPTPTNLGHAVPGWSDLPVAMEMAVTTSVFEDALSFHGRVMVAVRQHLRGVLDEEYHSLDLGCVDFMGRAEIREIYGEPFPSYVPIHRLAISRTLRAEMKVEKLYSSSGRRSRTDAVDFDLGLAPGAIVEQRVYKDRTPRLWNWDAAAVINIQILNAVAFKSVTGFSPPLPAISFEEYTRAGLPLLSFYDADDSEPLRLSTSPNTGIRSIGEIDRHHGLAVGVRMKPDHRPVICAFCEHRLCNAVLVPCHHIFCSWCIRFSMTEDNAVTCGICKEPAPTVNVYAAATGTDKGAAHSERRGQEATMPVQKLKRLFDRDFARNWPTRPIHECMGNPDLGDLIPPIPPSALMIAQILREWEMGLRSEAEVKDLATELFTIMRMEERGCEDPLKAFVTFAASMERDWGEWNTLVMGERGRSGSGEAFRIPIYGSA